ncbi:hypothetical protein KGM_203019 [Danaus plexippus plexippus]|uniref:Uncharacterized protein n=1 Tax=Danaus plexippus plexippus TaxID=278856 RepID=A0A212EKG3_DANPL|nr:hypothetical protein KGM_203019 [Danaus plexippus plexippus]
MVTALTSARYEPIKVRFEKYTTVAKSHRELLFIQETFEWPVVEVLLPGEVLTVQLIMRGRFGTPRLMGIYRLGMHILVNDRHLTVTDSLVDNNNRAVPVSGLYRGTLAEIT